MKWIEPENGGKGIFLNLSAMKTMRMYDERFIRFYEFSGTYSYWEYPDESSRNADFERIRRIALGIVDHAEKKPAENADPYEVDWSKIPDGYDYVATDQNGHKAAYDICPNILIDYWINTKSIIFIEYIKNNPDWENSLRVRPGTEKANA